ncbi:MAG: HEAT repeat domain-containing protein [Planctomycetota bacterium]|nr:HEAT repeat domain-containing protein [Planctomycetota bacterium]
MRPLRLIAAGTVLLAACAVHAGLVTTEEGGRQRKALAALKQSLEAESSAAGKLALIGRALKDEPDVDVRRRMLDLAEAIDAPELDGLLVSVLSSDPDSMLRSAVATTIGHRSGQACIEALVHAAKSDPTTSYQADCMAGMGNARRSAMLALGEMAVRFPASAKRIAHALSEMPDPPQEPDVRRQALYQATRDPELLKPFLERLRSDDAKTRERGVVAFRFFRLRQAPPELVRTLGDPSFGVRSWTALVLGEIGDPATVKPLMAAAGDVDLDSPTRCNAIASLGRMKAKESADLLERLTRDPEPNVPGVAAVALYRVTGRKVAQFPEGYNAD